MIPESLLHKLQCPFCEKGLSLQSRDPGVGPVRNGLLACECSKFPIVNGIAVIKKDLPPVVFDAVARAAWQEALSALLLDEIPERLQLRGARALSRVTGFSLVGRKLFEFEQQRRVSLIEQFLTEQKASAREALHLVLSNSDFGDYLYYKLGQPRHLAALGLIEAVGAGDGPVLDFGCAAGHITRGIMLRNRNGPIVGVDRFFGLLYVASRFVAPQGVYVCCDGEYAWPFADGIFQRLFCFDAFHYVYGKKRWLREAQRVVQPDGPLCIGSIRNALVPQMHEGAFISPEIAAGLMTHDSHVVISDDDVLKRYHQGRGPDLRVESNRDLPRDSELFSVISGPKNILIDHAAHVMPPHVVGDLGINPLLFKVHEADGRVKFARHFPTEFYRKENEQIERYLPEYMELTTDNYAALRQGIQYTELNERLQALAATTALIDLPPGYRGRPVL